ncbi:MAG: hypothetical protein ABI706_17425 [Ilumatobacteraceae bacterium]
MPSSPGSEGPGHPRTPLDVTIDELAIELFFPADDRTDEMLHTMALIRDG